MNAVLQSRARERAHSEAWHSLQTEGPAFLEVVLDAPLMWAYESDKALQEWVDKTGWHRGIASLRVSRDLDTQVADALRRRMLAWMDGKPQSPEEAIIGRWAHKLCEVAVQRKLDDADERGEFVS